MRLQAARLLRRFANKLDPAVYVSKSSCGQVSGVSYNGQPVDMDKVIVTALRNHTRRNGLGGLA
jgi:hypothetical protein